MTLFCRAFAKVNRSLVVLGKRPDGFHELDTVFQTIGLADRLFFEEADGLSLSVDDPSLPAGEDNLVVRAARALQRASGVRRGARVRLEKAIPAGGGLGGGSSDAAAALRGLSALWGLPGSLEVLEPLAATLGSDVPFFLHGGRARGTGRGERITPLPDTSREFLVLLVPPFSLSTPLVYGQLSARPLAQNEPVLEHPVPQGAPDRNDLEPAAEAIRPEVRTLREALRAAGARSARLSGSGSAVYGVFPSEDAARRAAADLPRMRDNTRALVVPTVSKTEFERDARPREIREWDDEGARWGVDKR